MWYVYKPPLLINGLRSWMTECIRLAIELHLDHLLFPVLAIFDFLKDRTPKSYFVKGTRGVERERLKTLKVQLDHENFHRIV